LVVPEIVITITSEFKSIEEEIFFLKHLKSRVYGEFVYYEKLLKITYCRPINTKEIQKRYFNEQNINHREIVQR